MTATVYRPAITDAAREAVGRLTAARLLLAHTFQADERELEAWAHVVAEETIADVIESLQGSLDDADARKDGAR